MTRDEILSKLKSIKPTAHPTVMTNDMGLQIDVMDSTGGITDLGNYGDWPLWKFKRLSKEQLEFLQNIMKTRKLVLEDFKNTNLYHFIEKILVNFSDADLNGVFETIIKYPDTEGEYFFIFCDVDGYKFELTIFGTEEEISKEFFSCFDIYNKWEDYDDDTLKEYLESLEESGEGLCFYNTEAGDEKED